MTTVLQEKNSSKNLAVKQPRHFLLKKAELNGEIKTGIKTNKKLCKVSRTLHLLGIKRFLYWEKMSTYPVTVKL